MAKYSTLLADGCQITGSVTASVAKQRTTTVLVVICNPLYFALLMQNKLLQMMTLAYNSA